eukprot:3658807-Pyramimonas_sp.AAC.1
MAEEWSGQDLCHVVCCAGFQKKYEFQRWLDVAESLSFCCIRARPTLCGDDVDASSGVGLQEWRMHSETALG